jgi:hypothetical protein
MNMVYTTYMPSMYMYVNVYTTGMPCQSLCMYMFVECSIMVYLWIHSMKAMFQVWYIKWIASGTHDAPAQI